jgi:DNA replication and repair protein RecF
VRLTALTVRDFRNLASLDLELPPPGIVVVGANGQGKTNLLEAIYYLVLFRSFRGARDRELVRFGEAGFFVAGTHGRRITAGYAVAGRRKKVTVAGQELPRLADAVGTLTAVVFSPADRAMVDGGPAARRRYLDVLLSLGAPGYLTQLARMRGALRQRNAALRRGQAAEARAFDAPFAAAAAHVAAARRRWAGERAARYAELCAALGEAAPACLRYASQRPVEEAASLREALGAALERDLRRATTTVGPQRDDLALELGGRDLRAFGSAGQQRTAAVALRLLEAETLRDARRAAPIALYDDVFAELDAARRANLLALIRETLPGQAIVTAPREDEVPETLLDLPRWRMQGGRLVR